MSQQQAEATSTDKLHEPQRPVSPAPSYDSIKSDWSKNEPLNFTKEESGPPEPQRPVSPAPSNDSIKSDWSKNEPLNFRKEKSGNIPQDDPLNFLPELSASMEPGQDGRSHSKDKDAKRKLTADLKKRVLRQHEKELRRHEPDTAIYNISAGESENAKPQTFDALFPEKQKKVRTVLMKGVAGVGKTFQTRLFMLDWAKEKFNKKIDLIVSFDFSELNSRRDKVESMTDLLHHSLNNDKHRVYKYEESKVAFILDGLEECALSLDFAKNKDLTDMKEKASMDVLLTNLIKGNLLPSACLWIISQPSGVDKIPPEYIDKVTECRETSQRRQKLVSALRERFLKETTQDEDINHPNQKNTEHIMREDKSGEVNDEEKNGCTAAKSVIRVNAVSDIFKDTKGQKIRTVLTTGEAGIGKSFHVQKFIKEWAKKDNKSALTWFKDATKEVLFQLNFSKLNLIKKKVSLVGLLNHFFEETKAFVISNFEQLKIVFVFDGLDAYQPPLDFDNNNTLTDVREPASLDVLLTSLIRGTLLPSARLWITSRLKLPETCVDRTTEIRCKLMGADDGSWGQC